MNGPLDHGALSGIRRKSTPAQRRREAAEIERVVDKAIADSKAWQAVEDAVARARYEAATARVPFTSEDLKVARAIRTDTGWHRVVKVNTKSVTVATVYSWNDRYTLDKILEVRA